MKREYYTESEVRWLDLVRTMIYDCISTSIAQYNCDGLCSVCKVRSSCDGSNIEVQRCGDCLLNNFCSSMHDATGKTFREYLLNEGHIKLKKELLYPSRMGEVK